MKLFVSGQNSISKTFEGFTPNASASTIIVQRDVLLSLAQYG